MSAKHPGKTPTQRRILDAIGCGDYSPLMAPRTRQALLEAGLIEPCGYMMVGEGAFAVKVIEYQMPISVHMQWCEAAADDTIDE